MEILKVIDIPPGGEKIISYLTLAMHASSIFVFSNGVCIQRDIAKIDIDCYNIEICYDYILFFSFSLLEALDFKERLVATVKKEVKQVMEEAVTRKFVHEQSSSVTSLCAAVEACLSQGLRRRALGLFKTSSTTALLHKVAKHCPEAHYISKKVLDIENADPTKRSSSSSDSTSKPPILKKNSNTSITNSASPPVQTVK